MAAAGLNATIDAVGNVLGRAPGEGEGVLIGSHTDTVPKGGWLDGALGVMYGLEIARAILAADNAAIVDVISFQDEEGTFLPCLGSKSLCREVADEDVDQARSPAGDSLREVLARAEIGAEHMRLERGRYRAYLEAHIEQGPRLEAAGKRVGVVTGIVGIRRFLVSALGRTDHAGTTPMSMRKDAGASLLHIGAHILKRFEKAAGPDTVWNIGKVTFEPGAANVVPGRAEMLVEFRDTAAERLDKLDAILTEVIAQQQVEGVVEVEASLTASMAPIAMDDTLGEVMAAAVRGLGEDPMHMPSGAGHDAMVLARHLPTALLFVPSIGGRSHDTSEDTSEDDIIFGCQALANAVAHIVAR
jgi:N-carbamoyl-L-amino-acid hydrolase